MTDENDQKPTTAPKMFVVTHAFPDQGTLTATGRWRLLDEQGRAVHFADRLPTSGVMTRTLPLTSPPPKPGEEPEIVLVVFDTRQVVVSRE